MEDTSAATNIEDPGGGDAEVPHSCYHGNRRWRRLCCRRDRGRHRPHYGRLVHLALARIINFSRPRQYNLSRHGNCRRAWRRGVQSTLRALYPTGVAAAAWRLALEAYGLDRNRTAIRVDDAPSSAGLATGRSRAAAASDS